jgi:hypothetical protein
VTEERIMAEENEHELRANQQREAFKEAHGYPAQLVPDVWVGQAVALNMLGGHGQEIASTRAGGILEAVRDEGFVLSSEERVVFIPKSAVLQIELHETSKRSRLRLQ